MITIAEDYVLPVEWTVIAARPRGSSEWQRTAARWPAPSIIPQLVALGEIEQRHDMQGRFEHLKIRKRK